MASDQCLEDKFAIEETKDQSYPYSIEKPDETAYSLDYLTFDEMLKLIKDFHKAQKKKKVPCPDFLGRVYHSDGAVTMLKARCDKTGKI